MSDFVPPNVFVRWQDQAMTNPGKAFLSVLKFSPLITKVTAAQQAPIVVEIRGRSFIHSDLPRQSDAYEIKTKRVLMVIVTQ